MIIKLEVGQTVELNNGEVHVVDRMIEDYPDSCYGPFVIDYCLYHQDGRFVDQSYKFPLSVKRVIWPKPEVDLTTIDKPFGELDRKTQVALFEAWLDGETIITSNSVWLNPYWFPKVVYKVSPKRVSGSVVYKDNEPDFSTWQEG